MSAQSLAVAPRAGRVRLGWAIALAAAFIPVAVRMAYYPHYPGSDDAFIHASIIQNIRSGAGWGINPGENVFLTTSPLFTLAFLGLSHLVPNVISAGLVASTIAVLVGGCGVYVVARQLRIDATLAVAATLLAATNLHLWRWGGTFMEVSFAYAAIIWTVALYLRLIAEPEAPRTVLFGWLGAVVGLTVLLRPESGLLGIAFFADHLIGRRRWIVRRFAAAALGLAVSIGAYAVWATGVFGSWLPTTLAAKTTSSLILVNPEVARQAVIVFGTGCLGSGLALLGAAAVLATGAGRAAALQALRPGAALIAVPLLVVAFYYLKAEFIQSAARYFLPFMATVPVFAALAVAASGSRLARKALWIGVGVQGLLALVLNHAMTAPVLARMWDQYVTTMSTAAAELDRRCMTGDRALVVEDIGVLSWRHDKTCYILDAGALATPDFRGKPLSEMVAAGRPRFVVETLGKPEAPLTFPGRDAQIVWEKAYHSHSINQPDAIFAARLYELRPHGGGND
ncbi:MAG: hypothetical protein AB7G10_27655 [Reyranellaceae bacterium]